MVMSRDQANELLAAIQNLAPESELPSRSNERWQVPSVIPGVVPTVAYTAGDAVGEMFNIRVPVSGTITGFKLIDPDDDTLALTAHVFTRPFAAAIADNAAFTVVAAAAPSWVTSVEFDDPLDLGGFKVAEEVGESDYYAPSGWLWIQCSTSGTPTIAAGVSPILVVSIRAGVRARLD